MRYATTHADEYHDGAHSARRKKKAQAATGGGSELDAFDDGVKLSPRQRQIVELVGGEGLSWNTD